MSIDTSFWKLKDEIFKVVIDLFKKTINSLHEIHMHLFKNVLQTKIVIALLLFYKSLTSGLIEDSQILTSALTANIVLKR